MKKKNKIKIHLLKKLKNLFFQKVYIVGGVNVNMKLF